MKKEKIIKCIITIIYFIIAIELFISFLDTVMNPDAMGINFICSLPLLPISIFLIIYTIRSTINIIQNKIKITIIDKIILISFIIIFILTLLIYIIYNSNNGKENVIESNFTIPGNYLHKYESHMQYVDGADVDYYIYSDKIIVDTRNSYPLGQYSYTYEHTIKLYDNLTIDEINSNDYHKLIQNKKGKIVLHEYK